jgi:hypothetical protein
MKHCDYNWVGTESAFLKQNIYKLDNQRIQDYNNSFNCLQIYSHYNLSVPINLHNI